MWESFLSHVKLKAVMSWKRLWHWERRKMEESSAWLLNQWRLPGLLKRGIQPSASEENQWMAGPLSSAPLPGFKEKAWSQGCCASGPRIGAILPNSGLTCGSTCRALGIIICLPRPSCNATTIKSCLQSCDASCCRNVKPFSHKNFSQCWETGLI